MNDFLELIPVPAERDLPSGRLEHHKAALLQRVEADLRTRRGRRLRGLRAWLTSLGIMLALIGVAGSTLLTTHFRTQDTRVAVEAVALGGAHRGVPAARPQRAGVAIPVVGFNAPSLTRPSHAARIWRTDCLGLKAYRRRAKDLQQLFGQVRATRIDVVRTPRSLSPRLESRAEGNRTARRCCESGSAASKTLCRTACDR